jgi:hypothetical protein
MMWFSNVTEKKAENSKTNNARSSSISKGFDFLFLINIKDMVEINLSC